jgi:UDP-N-acetylmuramate--alanine ligase
MRIPPHTVRQIHFVGIGGIGMSGIAEVLHNLGYVISGSDIAENSNMERLRRMGVTIHIGHREKNIAGSQVVVVSSAIKGDNPEVIHAGVMRIPVVRRAEMLAELMRLKLSVAISGTHGKTTTTSLMGALFETAGLDPTIINGGIINAYGTNARLGGGEWVVVEADESDGSFTKLPATIAVITNMDPEHMDHYGTFEAVQQAYLNFVDRIPFFGLAILCVDDANVRGLLPHLENKRYLTYGFDEIANVRAVNLRFSDKGTLFDVELTASSALACRTLGQDKVLTIPRKISNLFLPMMGQHNVQNALSVVAVAQELAISDEVINQAFAAFKGVKRRFTIIGESHGITVVDDYAHHPVEIQTVITSARQASPARVIAVVQPHRYSRVEHLMQDFCTCFAHADIVIVAPIYGAGETPIPGITSEALAEGIRAAGKTNVHTIIEPRELPYLVRHLAQAGDIVLCLGAGSITNWAAALPAQLDQLVRDAAALSEEKEKALS